jgi:hypothetical protein
VKTPVDARLREESARFALRFRCDDCVHFRSETAACAHGYPTDEHRGPVEGPFVVFCKEFELG